MRKRNFATKTAAVILSAAMALSACPAFAAETDSPEDILDAGAEVILDAEADTAVTDETTAADSGTNESAAAVTNEAADDGSQDAALVISVEEYTGEALGTEALIAEASEEESETETESAETVTSGYGTLSITYAEFYSMLGFDVSSVDAVSSATTGKSTMFANEYTSEVTDSGYTIYGVKVPVYVEEGASESLLAAVTFNADPETAEDGVQYWTVSGNTVTAPTLETKATVTDATAELSTSSNWGDYLVAITETSTSNLRNTRSDEGFAVGSNILGIIVTTTDGSSYGLTHMNNIWVQTYEFAFNADDANTAGLVGKTIRSVTYIVPDASYVYEFADGIYVKPAYTATAISGMFSEENSVFTLDSAIPSTIQDATITITYKAGRTTYTLLSETTIGSTLSFTLETAVPETDENGDAVVPTVTIGSSNYADIEAYYGGLSWLDVKDGLTLDDDDVFRYYENGVCSDSYTGVVTYDGGLFFIRDSLVDKGANGLCLYQDVWYYVSLGQVQLQYTGLVQYDDAWFYITDGVLDPTVNGLISYDGETFLVAAGRLLLDYNGLWQNAVSIGGDDQWYFIAAGQVQKVTQVVMYDGKFFYLIGGMLATGYNGTLEYDGTIFTVVAGQLYDSAE